MYRPIKKILNFQIIFILGYAIFGSGLMLMSFAGNYALFFISSSISGLGFGLVIPNLSFYLIENTSLKNRGRISSGYNAMFFLGRFLSPIIFEPILTLTNLANTIKIVGIIAFVLTFVSIVIFLINISIKRKRKLISYQNNQ
jgi:MFS family permease